MENLYDEALHTLMQNDNVGAFAVVVHRYRQQLPITASSLPYLSGPRKRYHQHNEHFGLYAVNKAR
ncbi:hypothetical protein [Mucilaginibacter lappiensis]|jgi:hypothetical protein|uniref:hypothetical protein n=1 Tax=Mucilaginibacter lappiensis TaxID=354630 RepID=UPI003D1A18DA